MVAFVISVTGLLALGLAGWVPSLLGRDSGVHVTEPGLFQPARLSRGRIALGDGLTVTAYLSGLEVERGDDTLLRTVQQGSLFSVVMGSVSGSGTLRVEHVRRSLNNLRIDAVRLLPGGPEYQGIAYDDVGAVPVTLRVLRVPGHVVLRASAPGADAIVFHLHPEPNTIGDRPALPAVNLRKEAWWVGDSRGGTWAQPAFSTFLGTSLSIEPAGVDRAVDLRESGHTDVHVWSDSASITVTDRVTTRVRD